eukprot:TRINITY_DN9124_c0_g1_i4.p1 TRINITY_DN9124_c0_g1~~TRINITY_DN9124_c0_g1_i4.p1  ORF type:complete len:1375 (+),score=282.08 TRINITY_DN9124_c0_g1_i4:43-4167(+)
MDSHTSTFSNITAPFSHLQQSSNQGESNSSTQRPHRKEPRSQHSHSRSHHESSHENHESSQHSSSDDGSESGSDHDEASIHKRNRQSQRTHGKAKPSSLHFADQSDESSDESDQSFSSPLSQSQSPSPTNTSNLYEQKSATPLTAVPSHLRSSNKQPLHKVNQSNVTTSSSTSSSTVSTSTTAIAASTITSDLSSSYSREGLATVDEDEAEKDGSPLTNQKPKMIHTPPMSRNSSLRRFASPRKLHDIAVENASPHHDLATPAINLSQSASQASVVYDSLAQSPSQNMNASKPRPPMYDKHTTVSQQDTRRVSVVGITGRRASTISNFYERKSSIASNITEHRGSLALAANEKSSHLPGHSGDRRLSVAYSKSTERRPSVAASAMATFKQNSAIRRNSTSTGNRPREEILDLLDIYSAVSIFGASSDPNDAAIPSMRLLLVGDGKFTLDLSKYLEAYNKEVFERFGAGLIQFEAAFSPKIPDAILLIETDEKGFDMVVCEFDYDTLVQPDFSTFLRLVQEEHEIPLIMTSFAGMFAKKSEKARQRARPAFSKYIIGSVFPIFHGSWLREMEVKLQKANDVIAKQNQDKLSLRWKLTLLDSERKKNVALQQKIKELTSGGTVQSFERIMASINKPEADSVSSLEQGLSRATKNHIEGLKCNPKTVRYLKQAVSDFKALYQVTDSTQATSPTATVPLSTLHEIANDWPSILHHARAVHRTESKKKSNIFDSGFSETITPFRMVLDELYYLSSIDSAWGKGNISHMKVLIASLWKAMNNSSMHFPMFLEPTTSAQAANLVIAKEWVDRHFSVLRNHPSENNKMRGRLVEKKPVVNTTSRNDNSNPENTLENPLAKAFEDKAWERNILGMDHTDLPDLATAAFEYLGFFGNQSATISLDKKTVQEFFSKRLVINDLLVDQSPHLYILLQRSARNTPLDKPFLLRTITASLLNATYLVKDLELQTHLRLDSFDVLTLMISISSHRMCFGEPEKVVSKDDAHAYKFSTERSLYQEVGLCIDLIRQLGMFPKSQNLDARLFAGILEVSQAADPMNYWEVIGSLQSYVSLKEDSIVVDTESDKKIMLKALLLLSQWWYVCSPDFTVWGVMVQDFLEKQGDMEKEMGLSPPSYMDRMQWINIGPTYHLFAVNTIVGPILELLKRLLVVYNTTSDRIDKLIQIAKRNAALWTQQIGDYQAPRNLDLNGICIPDETIQLQNEIIACMQSSSLNDYPQQSSRVMQKRAETSPTVVRSIPVSNNGHSTLKLSKQTPTELSKISPRDKPQLRHASAPSSFEKMMAEEGNIFPLPPLSYRTFFEAFDESRPTTTSTLVRHMRKHIKESADGNVPLPQLSTPRKAYSSQMYTLKTPDLFESPVKGKKLLN